MKQLSIEQKCKEYLERAKEQLNGAKVFNYDNKQIAHAIRTTVYSIFPELKESEDERIRKALIDYFDDANKADENPLQNYGIHTDKVLVWLKKQREQKEKIFDFKASDWYVSKVDGKIHNIYSANKVEPKFKVGDWAVTSYGKVNQVIAVDVDGDGFTLDDDTYFSGSWKDNYHLWTIQDAKDGDVLHSTGWHNDCIFIFNGLDNWKFDEPNGDRAVATGYCCLFVSADKMEFDMQGPDCVEVNTVKPATKIQRDLLFQKMKEAGYEWDADKKELKNIEQKKEWKQENVGDLTDFENAMMHIGGSFFGNNAGLDPNNTNSIKEQANLLLMLIPKSVEWSEEDEKMFGYALDMIEWYSGKNEDKSRIVSNWLKSLKERVQPQIKQKWSEDDKKKYIGELQSLMFEWSNRKENMGICIDRHIDKLLFLHPQSHWKPSDEQMERLNGIIYSLPHQEVLYSLYQDLKKLKGE